MNIKHERMLHLVKHLKEGVDAVLFLVFEFS